MLGENEDEEIQSSDYRALCNKSPLVRAVVFGAGAFMNIVLAMVIFIVIMMNFGFKTNTIKCPMENSPAASAGLLAGDKIIRVNGSKVITTGDVSVGIALGKGNPIEMTIDRAGQEIEKIITPEMVDNSYRIGIEFEKVEKPKVIEAINESFKEIGSLVKQTFFIIKNDVYRRSKF